MNTKSDFRDITTKVFKSGATLSPVTLKDNTIHRVFLAATNASS